MIRCKSNKKQKEKREKSAIILNCLRNSNRKGYNYNNRKGDHFDYRDDSHTAVPPYRRTSVPFGKWKWMYRVGLYVVYIFYNIDVWCAEMKIVMVRRYAGTSVRRIRVRCSVILTFEINRIKILKKVVDVLKISYLCIVKR